MRESVCTEFFAKFLWEVSKGHGYREHENPAVQFRKDAKAGKYNDMSDQCYELLLQEIKNLSAFWLNRSNQKAFDIFRCALENIYIDEESLYQVAEILSKCYFSTATLDAVRKVIPEMQEFEKDLDLGKCFPDIDMLEKLSPSFQENTDEEDEIVNVDLNSPQEMDEWLAKHIFGQRKAVRAAAMLLYNHRKGRKRNVLFVGPTGCGKTEIWRACKQIYPNIHIVDSNMITAEGWKGEYKISSIFENMSKQEAENAIIVFDEFDKFCEPKIGSNGTNYSLTGQNELLKLIEGTILPIKVRNGSEAYKIDTSKISFVFCGSFEVLTEMKTDSNAKQSIGFGADLKKKEAYLVYEDRLQPSDLVQYAGVRQEIAGRINQIVQLSPMNAGAYKEILKDEQMSPLHQLERQYSIRLSMDKDTEEKLVQEAEETHMGVRYLRSRIQQMLDEQMFRDCGQEEYELGA